MNKTPLLIFLCLAGCTAESDGNAIDCTAGTVETYTALIGDKNTTVEHCLPNGWKSEPCVDAVAGTVCQIVTAPEQPNNGGADMLFSDFMFMIYIYDDMLAADRDPWPGPSAWGAADLAGEGYAINEAGQGSRYGGVTNDLIAACDHPDTNEVCPFTWYRKRVVAVEETLTADVSGAWADFQNPNDVTTAPEAYGIYLDQVETLRIGVD